MGGEGLWVGAGTSWDVAGGGVCGRGRSVWPGERVWEGLGGGRSS